MKISGSINIEASMSSRLFFITTISMLAAATLSILATVVDPMVSNPLRWADLSSNKQTEWSQYRTDLLNVPQQAGFPASVTWPTEPE